ncbi:MAG: aldo/keto reductase, partial [Verrucomicrobia bacterium]|nr:aldo/keto reductase [Verrucomicrobiota bacterium]
AALDAVEEIRKLVPEGVSMASFALRWILDHEAVSCVIPGARNAQQVIQNVAASALPQLTAAQAAALANLYSGRIRELVHQRW